MNANDIGRLEYLFDRLGAGEKVVICTLVDNRGQPALNVDYLECTGGVFTRTVKWPVFRGTNPEPTWKESFQPIDRSEVIKILSQIIEREKKAAAA